MATVNQKVLPGFRLSLGYTVCYLSFLVLIPLAACFLKASSLSFHQFVAAVWTDRARAAYQLSFTASLISAGCNVLLGLLVAWVLVRYEFPLKRLFDALVDLPLALPTAVAGLVYSSLYVPNGWMGRFLVPLGIEGAYSRLGIIMVLAFRLWCGPCNRCWKAWMSRSRKRPLSWARRAGKPSCGSFCRASRPLS